MEAPTMAGYGSATDLAPQDAYRPLLGASWPELARRYLQEHGALTVSQDAVDAVLRLKAGVLHNNTMGVSHIHLYRRQGLYLPSSPLAHGVLLWL